MKSFFSFLFLFYAQIIVHAQSANYTISQPIDIPQEGWNKVLQMKNGNTLFFHFQENKGIVVTVYDSTHKELTKRKHICKIFDINRQDKATLKALYEINGEAVLFLQQTIWSKNALIILRINSTDASLVEERILLESADISHESYFQVINDTVTGHYYVYRAEDVMLDPANKLSVTEFNEKHQPQRKIFLNLDGKKISGYGNLAFQISPQGNLYLVLFTAAVRVSGVHPIYDKYLVVNALGKTDTAFTMHSVKLPDDSRPLYARIVEKDALVDLIMVDGNYRYYEYGVRNGVSVDMDVMLLVFNRSDWRYTYKWLSKQLVKLNGTDSTVDFHGIPVNIFIDKDGLTNIIYQQYVTFKSRENGLNINRTNLGYVVIGKYTDGGKLYWSSAMSNKQSIRTFLTPLELIERGHSKALFRHSRIYDYTDQFSSVTTAIGADNVYIFYNDFWQNFDKASNERSFVVEQEQKENVFETTDAFYYKLSSGTDVSKKYLFEALPHDQSISNMLESGDFNPSANMYATVVLCRKNNKITTHVAWAKIN